MKKIIVLIIVIGLLLTTSIVSVNAFNIEEETGELETLGSYFHAISVADVYVDDDADPGGDGSYEYRYQYIQDGVDAAEDGDIVFVFSGTYTENVVVDKSITLKGEDKDTTIIDGNFINNTIWVKTSYVNIKRFTIINSPNDDYSAGIHVSEFIGYPTELLTDVSISNCIMSNNNNGIRLRHVAGSHISNCIINSNHGHSVYLIYSENVMIDNCEIYNNGEELGGGWLTSGGIQVVHGITVDMFCKNVEISNCQIHNNLAEGICIHGGSINVEIHHNTISENDYGLCIRTDASDIDIHHNIITKNGNFGIHISGSSGVSIHNNVISETSGTDVFHAGIYIVECHEGVTIQHNNILLNNKYGVFLIRSSGNDIIENNFIENEKDATFHYCSLDESNTWDRNYWNRPRVLPKSTLGLMKTERGWIPWVEFDWHPAKEPYNIIV